MTDDRVALKKLIANLSDNELLEEVFWYACKRLIGMDEEVPRNHNRHQDQKWQTNNRNGSLMPIEVRRHHEGVDTTRNISEETVRGYTMSVTHTKVDAAEAEQKRKAVAKVIARSLRQMKEMK